MKNDGFKIRKEPVVQFKVLSRHFPGGTEENREKTFWIDQSPRQDFNLVHS